GVEDTSGLALVTGLKGFDKAGEALRDLAQTTYILRVGKQNTLVPVFSEAAATVSSPAPWWNPEATRILWFLLGAVTLLLLTLVIFGRKRVPLTPSPAGEVAAGGPLVVATALKDKASRPARVVSGDSCWFASEFFFGSDAASQQALQVVRK